MKIQNLPTAAMLLLLVQGSRQLSAPSARPSPSPQRSGRSIPDKR
ncbi:MAG: hypothetical protein ABI651_01175 [Verrucomicrobiota bacterium]